jgi:hypothetical protein
MTPLGLKRNSMKPHTSLRARHPELNDPSLVSLNHSPGQTIEKFTFSLVCRLVTTGNIKHLTKPRHVAK